MLTSGTCFSKCLTTISYLTWLIHYGLQDQQKDVMDHCVKAEPRHGEIWCSISKKINNWKLKISEILPLVAEIIEIPS